MLPLTSLFLDATRFTAAVGVVASHVASAKFGREIPILVSLGHACVAVFFVLSGYVIAWVAETRETSGQRFMEARFARLYSVLIPALILTLLLDPISQRLDPGFFETLDLSAGSALRNFVSSLLFLNQSYGIDHNFSSNSPVWSLGYEMSYYVLFASMTYLRSLGRTLAVAAILLLQGPAIWVLFPVWWMGVASYRAFGRRPARRGRLVALVLGVVVLLAMAPLLVRLQNRIYQLEAAMTWVEFGHSNQLVFFYVVGGLMAAMIALVQALAPKVVVGPGRFPHLVRELAASTFSIYLFHFPILVLLYAATKYDRGSIGNMAAVLLVSVGCSMALSFISERRKSAWHNLIRSAFGSLSARAGL